MKKVLSILFAFMLVLSFSACDVPAPEEPSAPSSTSPESISTESPQDSQPADTTAADETEPAVSSSPDIDPESITIPETVLVDEAGVKITAKEIDVGGLFGPEIKLLIENNSGMDLTFQCRNASVNGYMAETIMSVDVADGKKANDSLIFMESSLDLCGIDIIADMEFSFHIFDSAQWETYLDTEPIIIKTSAADTYVYRYDDSGNLAYEGNGIKVVVKELSEDASLFGPSIVVYIENASDQDVTIQTRDESVNGFMVETIFSCDIAAGKYAISTITFMESDLEENNITTIDDVELYFHIVEADGWDTIVDTDIIILTF